MTRLQINKTIVAKSQSLKNSFPWEREKIGVEIKKLKRELRQCKK